MNSVKIIIYKNVDRIGVHVCSKLKQLEEQLFHAKS